MHSSYVLHAAITTIMYMYIYIVDTHENLKKNILENIINVTL